MDYSQRWELLSPEAKATLARIKKRPGNLWNDDPVTGELADLIHSPRTLPEVSQSVYRITVTGIQVLKAGEVQS